MKRAVVIFLVSSHWYLSPTKRIRSPIPYQAPTNAQRGNMWGCTSPNLGRNSGYCSKNSCSDEEDVRAYSPKTDGHFYYRNSIDRRQPPVAVVIPPGNGGTNANATSKTRSGMITEITVGTNDNVSSKISEDDALIPCACGSKWGGMILCLSISVFLVGVFSIGFGVGLGTELRIAKKSGASSNENGSNATDRLSRNSKNLLVGAYYYPWYGKNFHNEDGYLRSQLVPPQLPTLGQYNDANAATISQHLKWSRQANIGLWVTSWWGPNRLEDSNTKYGILKNKDLGDMKIALQYESTGRVRNGNMQNVMSDIAYICENYFDHANYYKIDDRPVIFVYVTRKLESQGYLEETLLTMRSAADRCQKDIFIVGDQAFQEPPVLTAGEVYNPFYYLDAVTNYDMYGSMGSKNLYAGTTAVTEYYAAQQGWKDLAGKQGSRYVPTVSPGFNDRGVRLSANHQPLSRKVTADSVEGSLFATAIEQARRLVDPKVDNLLMVNSFNEWHEDTQIEPCVGLLTNSPQNLTEGLEYTGYGELYLNLLHQGTQPEGKQSVTKTSRLGGN